MQGRETRIWIFAHYAEKYGKGNPQRQHDDQHPARRRFVNQNLGHADNQSDPTLGRVEEMDPFRIGFHARKDITERGEAVVFPLPTGA
jgi:hypothetical protein